MSNMLSTDKALSYMSKWVNIDVRCDTSTKSVTITLNGREITLNHLVAYIKSMPNTVYKDETKIFLAMANKKLAYWRSNCGNSLVIP